MLLPGVFSYSLGYTWSVKSNTSGSEPQSKSDKRKEPTKKEKKTLFM